MADLRTDLAVRILCDQIPPGSLDAAYLFGQTLDNEHSVFQSAERIFHDGLANHILFSASEPRSGYPGFGPWWNALRQIGIPEEVLLGVPAAPTEENGELMLHTLNEAVALVRFCKDRGFARVGVVSSAFHSLRAFLSTVSAASLENRGLRVYCLAPAMLPWYEEVVHSQGKERGTRFALIQSELERIARYREKGDLVSDEVLLAYLESRDANA